MPVTADSPVDYAACSEQDKSIFNQEKQVDNLLHKNISLADACTQGRLEVEELEAVNLTLKERLSRAEEERDLQTAEIASM